VSDEYTVPLCRTHHREVHRYIKELGWWEKYNLDPTPIASSLWRQTHPTGSAIQAADVDKEPDFPPAELSVTTSASLLPKGRRNRRTRPAVATGAP
jgi:hypothetical protein